MEFINFVIDHCLKNKITFTISPTSDIPYPGSNLPCSGYFVVKDDMPRLGYGAGDKNGKEILLHELCHSLQWLENSPHWTNNYLTSEEYTKFGITGTKVEAVDVIDMWTSKTLELAPEHLTNIVNRAIMVEADCEKRTAELGDYHFPGFDKELYAQKANSYLRLYKFVESQRRWGVKGHPPYSDDKVIAAQLDSFDQDYTAPLTEKELKIYMDYVAE